MKHSIQFAVALVVSFGFVSCPAISADKPDKQMRKLYAMTPDDFAKSADVKDDALEPIAVISTVNGYQRKTGLLKSVGNDAFIRAFVDKRTGEASYQIYAQLFYDSDWLFFYQANYLTSSGLKTQPLTVISRDVLGCYAGAFTVCNHSEAIGFDLTEGDVRWVASQYIPNGQNPWQFRLKSKAGKDPTGALMPAEFAGIVKAVDAYRARKGLNRVNGSQ